MKIRLAVVVLGALVTVPMHPGPGSAEPGAGETGRSPAELEKELEEFVPSEGLPADSAISFPVDI